MNLVGKKVLVTGADGFIGSHLVELLVQHGCQVRAFVCYNSFGSWGWLDHLPLHIRDSIEIFLGDIRDPYGVKVATKNCEVIFHLAALIGIPYSYHSPDTYVDTNIKGTLNVVQAARDLNVARVIQTSTSEVYGTAQFVPITELHPLNGQSPYSASKIGADQIAMSFYKSFNTPVSVIRPFNTYGPRQSARAVIPTVITQIAQGKDNIQLGSLHPTRDFTYVADTARGFLSIAQSDDSIGEVINIGSNFEVTVGQTVHLIAELMQADVKFTSDSQRLRPDKSEVDRLWADNSKAKQLLNWEPTFSGNEGFKRGLSETIRWFTNADNLKMYKDHVYNI
ncbi:MAG: NAD-dependent dehydratase [Gammaproteobacteria bacterium RIFCSPHIGHO2_12_FULL_37_14]|nr:MAG: NAD-dependent dehydratase [Gammaproteobacteria bacterium RIFCSPHIGHO2_12_FULL_37_14]